MKKELVLSKIQINMAQPWQFEDGKPTAPAVLIKEGVWCGSQGCILHTAESLKNSVKEWDGKPVTLGHPHDGTNYVSVHTSPAVYDQYVIGKLKSPYFADKALKAYIEIDKKDAGLWQLLQTTKEVSVGVFTEDIIARGSYNGKTYEKISQFYRPDHLALLPNEKGACSFDDGAGIRVNQNNMDIYRQVADVLIRNGQANAKLRQIQKNKDQILLPIELTPIQPINKPAENVLLPVELSIRGGHR